MSSFRLYTVLAFVTALAPITGGDANDSMKNCGKEKNFLPQFFAFLPFIREILGAAFLIYAGNVTVIVVPFPTSLCKAMPALKYPAACFTMESPRPVPPDSLEWLLSTR